MARRKRGLTCGPTGPDKLLPLVASHHLSTTDCSGADARRERIRSVSVTLQLCERHPAAGELSRNHAVFDILEVIEFSCSTHQVLLGSTQILL